MRRTGSLFLSLFFFAAATANAHDLPPGSNLVALGRIWGVVEYAHPWVGYRDVDLDAAAIRSIEHLRSSPRDISGAVAELLAVLGDDAAFVRPPCVESSAPAVDRSTRTLAPGIVYVAATSPVDASTLQMLRTAQAAVVDLRPQPGRCTSPMVAQELVSLLVRGSVPRADLRKVKHHGYRSQDPAAEEQRFQSGFVTIDNGVESGNGAVAKVVFIVNDRSYIPPFATALAAAETATFVTVGRFPLASALDHCEIGLPDGGIATLRTSELVDADGYGAEPSPMIAFAADAPEADVVAAALQLAKPRGSRRRASGPATALRLPDYEWHPDATYADMQMPDAAHRILAAYRIWNAIEFLHPNPGREWHMQLGEMIAMLEHANRRQEYELALAEIVARVPDGQAALSTRALAATPPFLLMPVEDKPVVVESSAASVKPGDELLRIDGRDVTERMAELARFAGASTETAKRHAIVRDLTNGAAGSQSVFTFRRPDGTTYDATLARGTQSPNAAKPWRILDGGIAYVDLRQLDAEEVPMLFAEVAGTRALILDLRGESRGVADDLAARMNATGASAAALVRVPELIGGAYDAAEVAENVSASSLPPYTGRAIVLIDERTQADGEATALLLAAVANAEFVGVPSAGASGPVTSLVVPGNIFVRFTGGEARHTDGRAVHGVGITPDYPVARTIRGLAEGKDAALERALELANR